MTEHPTNTKDRLMNKILSNLMLSCTEKISAEQVDTLQQHKDTPSDFDVNTKGYFELLNFNLQYFAPNPELSAAQQSGPVELSRQEV